MKYKIRMIWTSEFDQEVEAESTEDAIQKGYEMIEDICVGTGSINPDVFLV